jgi:DNA replicative helicase MCM subunit Mcm2 (Cdc46/Mcm family)
VTHTHTHTLSLSLSQIFDEVALGVTLKYFPEYDAIHREIHVRITNLPADDQLRDIRYAHCRNMATLSALYSVLIYHGFVQAIAFELADQSHWSCHTSNSSFPTNEERHV